MKVVLFCGGLDTHPRIFREHTQADDPRWVPANPMARHAILQPLWAPRLRALPRLQGERHQRVFSIL
jgi:hypothetical protein